MAVIDKNTPAPDVQTKQRVQLDFSPEAYERLNEIQKMAELGSKADTIRSALRLYEWFVTEVDPNSTIKIFDPNGEVSAQFKAKLLLK